jgi:ubiquinone/menaquinone biosynthesis C-methylase UbiE
MNVAAENAQAEVTLKDKHRGMWALGDYATVASTVIPDLGAVLVAAAGITAGDRVLDVAAGSGNAAIPAALSGADVVACDLTPELLASGRLHAEQRGAHLEWRVADAEALPFSDGEFDKVISCVGVMFAPHHQAAADELVRVCRPGGTVGLINWTPEGFVGQMLAATKPYLAPSPAGTLPPPLWGDTDHVSRLLGERVTDLVAARRTVTVDCFPSPEAFRDFFKSNYGPTVAAYRGIEDDPRKLSALDADLVELARRHDRGTEGTVMDWQYLLVTAPRR